MLYFIHKVYCKDVYFCRNNRNKTFLIIEFVRKFTGIFSISNIF